MLSLSTQPSSHLHSVKLSVCVVILGYGHNDVENDEFCLMTVRGVVCE